LSEDRKTIRLLYDYVFLKGVIYELTIGKIRYCYGAELNDVLLRVSLPDSVVSYNDVVINEVLFDALSEESKYIEIYNNSKKVFDISNLYLYSSSTTIPCRISEDPFLFFPGDIVAVSRSRYEVLKYYYSMFPRNIITADIPYMTSSSSVVGIKDRFFNVIDKFHYDRGFHHPLLKDTKGVSLERINPLLKTESSSSWHSASSLCGYGTPGYRNSQYVDIMEEDVSGIRLEPSIISPNNDGYNDFCSIYYRGENFRGGLLKIDIYNSNGNIVRSLVNNDIMGSEGVVVWDGLGDNKEFLIDGIYVIRVRVLNMNGDTRVWKLACSLVRQ